MKSPNSLESDESKQFEYRVEGKPWFADEWAAHLSGLQASSFVRYRCNSPGMDLIGQWPVDNGLEWVLCASHLPLEWTGMDSQQLGMIAAC